MDLMFICILMLQHAITGPICAIKIRDVSNVSQCSDGHFGLRVQATVGMP